tara:strand:+ start:150 stop:407 length:258 start_codon:yes stop_codon:yes gene_type:complete
MKVQELLEDDSWLTKAFDKVSGFMNSGAPAKQYAKYLSFAKSKMNFTRDKDLERKLKAKFPELDRNNIDLIRVMKDIKKIRKSGA